MDSIPRRVREKLKHYVYLYVDPRDGQPFYVGKGKGNRGLTEKLSMSVAIRKGRTFLHNTDGRTVAEYAVFLALMVFAYWAFTKLKGL